MVIGVIGAGNMGRAVGGALARAGHEILFTFSRDDSRLQAAARRAGGSSRAVAPGEVAAASDVLFVACQYPGLAAALEETGGAGGAFDGKPVLTCVSALRPDFSGATVGLPTDRTASVAEEIAERAPGARVVEAFNTTFAEVIARGPGFDGLVGDGGPPSLFYCGDDAAAKNIAAALIRDCGFDPVDAGPLSVARSQETLASVWVQFAAVSGLFPGAALRALRG